jgi:hypothetical protein
MVKPIIGSSSSLILAHFLEWAAAEYLSEIDWVCIFNGCVKEVLDSTLHYLAKYGEDICTRISQDSTDISKSPAYFALAVTTGIVGWLCSLFDNRIREKAYAAIKSISDTLGRKFFTDEKDISKSKDLIKGFLSFAFEVFCCITVAIAGGLIGTAVGFFLLPAVGAVAVGAAIGAVDSFGFCAATKM